MLKGISLCAITLAAFATPAAAGGAPERPSETWDIISAEMWPDAVISDGDTIIDIDAPKRAQDAAVVPITVTLSPDAGRRVAQMTIIVEENPAPIAATFSFDERMGEEIALSTRVRVNAYSNVRVVARMDDGSLLEAARFVKASGGCSAPAIKDMDTAMATLGRMKLRHFERAPMSSGMAEAQVMVRHPNHSGFQVDQISLLTIPAFYIDSMSVLADGDPLFEMSGGISLSEDPVIRFSYRQEGAGEMEVRATDTRGGHYLKRFPMDAS
ncbi:MAG: quinoprotein dehydrogenase-associated SoxYZ-like carrier [Pseudomonadota bacterium]